MILDSTMLILESFLHSVGTIHELGACCVAGILAARVPIIKYTDKITGATQHLLSPTPLLHHRPWHEYWCNTVIYGLNKVS